MDVSQLSGFISEDNETCGGSILAGEHNQPVGQEESANYVDEFISSDETRRSREWTTESSSLWTKNADVHELAEMFAVQTMSDEFSSHDSDEESYVTAASKFASQLACWTQPSASGQIGAQIEPYALSAQNGTRLCKSEFDDSNDADVSNCFPLKIETVDTKIPFNNSISPILRPTDNPSTILNQTVVGRPLDELTDGQGSFAIDIKKENGRKKARRFDESTDIFEHLNSASSSELEEEEIRSVDQTRQSDQEISLDESRVTRRRSNLKDDREYLSRLSFIPINDVNRTHVVDRLFDIYNRQVFDRKFPRNLKFVWNSRFVSTAGQWNRCSMTISLATKLLNDGDRLRDTVLHELIHAAVNYIDGCDDGRCHSATFKSWISRVKLIFPHLPTFSICPNYSNREKQRAARFNTPASSRVAFRWQIECESCRKKEKRQYRQDIVDCRCGSCGGALDVVRIEDQLTMSRFLSPQPSVPTAIRPND